MKLIKINTEHYVVVDDSEIKEGDYYFSMISDNMFRRIKDGHWIENYDKKMYKKITHSTQPDKGMENVSFISPTEVKELIDEVDVEKKAEQEYREFPNNPKEHPDWHYNRDINCHRKRKAFIKGYNQAIEDNKERKYTKQDMVEWAMSMIAQYVQGNTNIWDRELLRESLPQLQTEWEVEIVDGKLKLK